MITLDTPLKFTAPGGAAYAGRGKWHLPQGNQPGEWMRDYKSQPVLCERGYHWCEARHAIYHLHAECWFIEPRGVTVRGEDKCVSQGGRLLRRVDTWNERTARLFAADCAESVVHLCGDDPRPRAAIDTARKYARGEASQEELAAAGAAAVAFANQPAGGPPTWVAARAAAWTTDYGAGYAVGAAAGYAAGYAASAAAKTATDYATRAAARATIRATIRDAQTALLLQYLNGERA